MRPVLSSLYTGIVQSIRNSGHTYIVILDADKGIKTRNRRFLRPLKVDPEAEAMEHIPDEQDAPAAPAAPATSKKTKKKKQDQLQLHYFECCIDTSCKS
jgi:hypothetical protein